MTKAEDVGLYGSIAGSTSSERTCFVRSGETSTFVVPGDWVPQRASDASGGEALASSFIGSDHNTAIKLSDEHTGHTGNEVKFYTTAEEAYADMLEDARGAITSHAADDPAFVIHVGWTCYLGTKLDSGTSYEDLMAELRDAGVKTRCLYWAGSRFLAPDQDALVQAHDRLNSWTTGDVRAITDDRVRDDVVDTGSHHQKIWVILGRNGLSAFYGGCDINTNRVLGGVAGDNKCPWHDVHARVRGPAAERFLAIALYRIVASIELGDDAVRPPEIRMELIGHAVGIPERHQVAHELYTLWARYTSTRGARRTYGGAQPSWVRAGDTIGNLYLARTFSSQIYSMVRQNISHAKRFIYVEDQYFWAWEFAQKLGDAVREGRVQYVVVLTNVAHLLAEQPQHTQLGLAHLAYGARGHTDRVFVFERNVPGLGLGRYVHSKTLIYDDVCVHTGSANFNWRGYTHDSESAAVAVDRIKTETTRTDVAASAARNLRAKLWSKHLGVDTKHLFDPIGAMAYFRMVERGETLPSNIMATGGTNKLSMPSLQSGTSLVPWRTWATTWTTEPARDVTLVTGDAGLGLAAEATEMVARYARDHDTESMEWLTDPRVSVDPE